MHSAQRWSHGSRRTLDTLVRGYATTTAGTEDQLPRVAAGRESRAGTNTRQLGAGFHEGFHEVRPAPYRATEARCDRGR